MKIPEAIHQDKNIKWILLMGLLQTAACAVTYWFRISNPNIILFVILSVVLVQFGYKAGILCGGIIYLYTMFYFSVEHSFWIFDTDGRGKVMVVAIGIVANILIVGSLKERMERINKERLQQLEIATTLNRCAAELSADRNTGVAIYNLLGIICNYFQAEVIFLILIMKNRSLSIHTNMQQRVFPVKSIISRKYPFLLLKSGWTVSRKEKFITSQIQSRKRGIPLTKCWWNRRFNAF